MQVILIKRRVDAGGTCQREAWPSWEVMKPNSKDAMTVWFIFKIM